MGRRRRRGAKKNEKKVRREEFVPADATPSFALLDCEEWWRGRWGGGGGGGKGAEAWHIGWLIWNLSARRRRGNTQGRRWEGGGRGKSKDHENVSLYLCVCVTLVFFLNQWDPKRIKAPPKETFQHWWILIGRRLQWQMQNEGVLCAKPVNQSAEA